MSNVIMRKEKSDQEKLADYEKMKNREVKYRLRREIKIKLMMKKCSEKGIIISEKEIDDEYNKLYK